MVRIRPSSISLTVGARLLGGNADLCRQQSLRTIVQGLPLNRELSFAVPVRTPYRHMRILAAS
jgi:hypothetical protein